MAKVLRVYKCESCGHEQAFESGLALRVLGPGPCSQCEGKLVFIMEVERDKEADKK